MNRNLKYDFDKTSYGAVIDDNEESVGFKECLTNLENLLLDIYAESGNKPKLSTKVLVLRSMIGYEGEEPYEKPYRYSKKTVKTIYGLLKEYQLWNKGDFNPDRIKNTQLTEFNMMEKARDNGEAWGPFMYVNKVHRELSQIENITKEEQDIDIVEKKIKEKRLSHTYRTHYT
ncbi:MAG: hypothetical protein WDZ62_01380 [Candidatus Pacearchaeota archaeon]